MWQASINNTCPRDARRRYHRELVTRQAGRRRQGEKANENGENSDKETASAVKAHCDGERQTAR